MLSAAQLIELGVVEVVEVINMGEVVEIVKVVKESERIRDFSAEVSVSRHALQISLFSASSGNLRPRLARNHWLCQ